MPRATLACAAALCALALAACGGEPRADPAPPPEPSPLRLPTGELPDTPLPGSFVDERRAPLTDVHVLAGAGTGPFRVHLLLGRSLTGAPCVGLRTAADESTLDCLEPWERPPLVVKVGVGGAGKRSADWLAVAGIAAHEVDAVEVETQSFRTVAAAILRHVPLEGLRRRHARS
jgi:hypothetical protein